MILIKNLKNRSRIAKMREFFCAFALETNYNVDEYKNKSQGLYCAYTLYSLEHRKEFSAITSSPTLPVTKQQSNKFTMSSRTTDWTSRL
jgi:hypothetical protein